jgi:phosphoglycolate phosphatase-like HAD superfamily hydrolase
MTHARHVTIFDLDGTLVDSSSETSRAVAECLRGAGYHVPPAPELLRRFVGPDLHAALVEYCAPPTHVLVRMIGHFRWQMASDLERIRAFPGIAAAVAKLTSTEHVVCCAVLTNRIRRFAESILIQTDLAKYFVAVSAADASAAARETNVAVLTKADRGISLVTHLRERHGPVSVTVVGDRLEDWAVARSVGARFVRAGWGYGSDDEFVGRDVDVCATLPAELPSCVLD